MVMINNLLCSGRKTIQVRNSTRRGFRDVVLLDIMPAIGYMTNDIVKSARSVTQEITYPSIV